MLELRSFSFKNTLSDASTLYSLTHASMTDAAVFKAPKSRKGVKTDSSQSTHSWDTGRRNDFAKYLTPRPRLAGVNLPPFPKRKRTSEDFYMFCSLILKYENYEAQKQDIHRKNSGSPIDSCGSGADSFSSESNSSSSTSSQDENKQHDTESDDDSWDLVTCFCTKPFAGRPMIECSSCLTWIHLSCAKVRRTNIPEEYICQRCRSSNKNSRRSQRAKLPDSPPPPTS